VVTENLVFAMPETGIGLFPDVGATYVLPRCPGQIGMYLGLTGARLGAADALDAGLADAYVPHARLGALEAALAETDLAGDVHGGVTRVIEGFAEPPGAAPLQAHRAAIDRCFAADTVEEMVAALRAEDSDWGRETAALLAAKSPTSLKIAWRQLRGGRALGFDDCMRLEYRLVRRCLARDDYYEGVRAAVIDKDGAPTWRPPSLAEVGAAEVEAHFEPLGEAELSFDWDPVSKT